jgi:hypothetical protein
MTCRPREAAGCRARCELVVVDVDADPALERPTATRSRPFAGDPATGVELCHYHLDLVRVASAVRRRKPRIEVASQAKIR